MKRFLFLILGFGLGCLVIFFASGSDSSTGSVVQAAAPAAPAAQAAKPIYGWRVCEDLGPGTVPGVGTRQRFRMCQGDGWVVLAYCLEVGKTPPPLNTLCSYVSATNIWCGDAYQYLQEYGVLATAAPTTAPTRTATATSTSTSTPTRTATLTRTTTATLTRTPLASLTSTRLATIAQQASATVARGGGNTRTRPGGPGNLESLETWGVAGLTFLTLLAAGLIDRALRKARRHSKERS
jgi:hypothetical protein